MDQGYIAGSTSNAALMAFTRALGGAANRGPMFWQNRSHPPDKQTRQQQAGWLKRNPLACWRNLTTETTK